QASSHEARRSSPPNATGPPVRRRECSPASSGTACSGGPGDWLEDSGTSAGEPRSTSRRPSEGAVELGTRGQTSAPPPRRGDGAELSAAVGPNPNSAQTVTLRSESIFDSSPGMTRLTPSPKAVSSTRTPLTSEANSRGSIDAD